MPKREIKAGDEVVFLFQNKIFKDYRCIRVNRKTYTLQLISNAWIEKLVDKKDVVHKNDKCILIKDCKVARGSWDSWTKNLINFEFEKYKGQHVPASELTTNSLFKINKYHPRIDHKLLNRFAEEVLVYIGDRLCARYTVSRVDFSIKSIIYTGSYIKENSLQWYFNPNNYSWSSLFSGNFGDNFCKLIKDITFYTINTGLLQ
jgi:hypothetical protein